MSCNTYFTRETVVDVDAAVIGICRKSWKSIEDKEAEPEKAQEIMSKERFDILPIESDSGVKEYYRTNLWSVFSSISRKQILDTDVIHCQTSLRDLIERFASQPKEFFFLGDEEEIVGLVSIVHLNERQVKVYLFNLLSELEIRLSRFLSSKKSDEELLEIEFETSDQQNDKMPSSYEKIKENYRSDVKNGVDVPFTEYVYLSNFIRIIRKLGLHKDLGYSTTQYDKLGSLVDLRHKVAHPNRSIITEADSVGQLWKRIIRIEEAVDKLKDLQGN